MFRIEHNVETGEVKQIELTPEEITELEQQYAEIKIKEDAKAAELAAQAAAEEAAKQQAFNDAVAAAVAAALAAQQEPAVTEE
jgi:anthranilate phosphoribosyltransferase